MPTAVEFEEEKHRRSAVGTFAEKPAEPKAYISKFADDPFAAPKKPNNAANPNSAGFVPTAEKVDPRAAAALRARHDAARRKVERERLAKRREERLAARRRQLRDRSAKLHGEPPESIYDNFYGQFDKDDIRRLKDKYLWTVQDNSIEQNLLLARRLGWPTGRGKDGHIFIVTPWGTRYRGNKPKKPKAKKKPKKAAKPQGFWHGFTSSGGPVTIEELRARVHRQPILTASAAGLRARVHGSPAVVATATSAWNSGARKGAAAKGIALPDGSYPIKDKTDWAKAKQALGRAKNRAVVVKHLIKRAKALGIPAEQYKGLTASSNTGMVAALNMTASIGEWIEALHPRGKNGKFIEKGGWVSGLFSFTERGGGLHDTKRSKVIGFAENTTDPDNPYVVVESPHGRGYGLSSNTTQVAGPKGSVDGDDDKQLSLADAPIGGNKEMPDIEVDLPQDPPIAARLKEGDRVVFRESDAVTNVSGLKDGDVVEVFDIVRIPPDPAGKNPNGSVGIVTKDGLGPTYRSETLIELDDEGKLFADDQGRERYDANEARWAEMNDYRDSLTTPGKARYDELIGEGASQQEIMELFAREDEQMSAEMAAQTQVDIAEGQESNNIKTWRNDLKKVQDALEQGGWITSTPDADAPGGTFTYIDPDAPPELVALYQKLIQFGYANGYEP